MLNIVKYKGCKRYGGDLFSGRYSEGISISCLQCGAIIIKHEKENKRVPETRRSKMIRR